MQSYITDDNNALLTEHFGNSKLRNEAVTSDVSDCVGSRGLDSPINLREYHRLYPSQNSKARSLKLMETDEDFQSRE